MNKLCLFLISLFSCLNVLGQTGGWFNIDTHLDSVFTKENINYFYVDGAIVDSTQAAFSLDSIYSFVTDSTLNDTLYLSKVQNIIDTHLDSVVTKNNTMLWYYVGSIVVDSTVIVGASGDNDGDWNINSNGTGLEAAPSANNTASGDYSMASGNNTTASGESSIAIGDNTTASGLFSTAMGEDTQASGRASTAMGEDTQASGRASTAMGYRTTASEYASTAIGESTTASGRTSTALGEGIEVSGNGSVGIGLDDQSGTDVSQDNTMSIMGGTVGIGTTSPTTQLHIVSSSDPLRLEGLQESKSDSILVVNSEGVIGYLHKDSLGFVFEDADSTNELIDSIVHGRNDTIVIYEGSDTISFFSANTMAEIFDGTGGQLVGVVFVDITLGTLGIVDNNYDVTSNSITIQNTGRYKVTYRVSLEFQTNSNTRAQSEHQLTVNGVFALGTQGNSYHRNRAISGSTVTVVKVLNLDQGDIIKVRSRRTIGNNITLKTIAQGSSLLVERL